MRTLLLASLAAAASPLSAQVREVYLASSPSTAATAWHSSTDGLVVRDWRANPGGDLVLGNASEPRFDATGRLYFVRSVDHEHVEVSRATWVLDPGTIVPRPAQPGERVPAMAPATAQGSGPAIKLTIDPGHGGSDPGALGNGLQEDDINLDVSLRLEALLIADTDDTSGGGNWDVLMTRSIDTTVSLSARVNAANAFGATSFLSVHMNAFSNPSANGTETFCHPSVATSTAGALRNRVQAEALAAWNLTDRGVKTANFFVLANTAMPAALLEGGFISNVGDAAVMADPNERQTMARHMLYALQAHHGFTPHDPVTTGRLRGIVYDSSIGTSAPLQNATVGLGDGTFTTTNSTGYFEFILSPGTYSYSVTASAFSFGQATRTVTGGADIWGSVGIAPRAAPLLSVSSDSVQPNQNATLTIIADPNSPVGLFLNLAPAVPLVDLSVIGFEFLWPALPNLVSVPLGSTNIIGTATLDLASPAGGFEVHTQVLSVWQGQFKLSNGTAFRID